MSPELSDYLQGIVMAQGSIKDNVHHLHVSANQLEQALDGLLNETPIGAQHHVSPLLIFAAGRAPPFPLGLGLGHRLRGLDVRLSQWFHHDRLRGATFHTQQG